MAFYVRKRIGIVPGLDLNVSKSGLGLSAGVTGLRVSRGPRGTQVSAGRGPVRYRKSLNGRPARGTRTAQRQRHSTAFWIGVVLVCIVLLALL